MKIDFIELLRQYFARFCARETRDFMMHTLNESAVVEIKFSLISTDDDRNNPAKMKRTTAEKPLAKFCEKVCHFNKT
jgi:hypothetical protein